MTDQFEITTDRLWSESRMFSIDLTRPTSTTIQLNWTPPPAGARKAVTGAVIIISEEPINPSNYLTDSVKYTPSTDLAAPSDTIGISAPAKVVGVFYDDLISNSLTLTNADPNKLYYASIHGASNVRQYYPIGIYSYPVPSANDGSDSSIYSGDIPHSEIIPINPFLGQVYYNPDVNAVFMWNGATWMPAGSGTVITGSVYPTSNPAAGVFFYNTNTKELQVWNGTAWIHANTENVGSPMYMKIGIGTDGTLDERLNLINILKVQLGYPKICVELGEEAFEMAIDNAVEEFRRRADNAYRKKYILFDLKDGQQTYYLNDPRLDTEAIVDIIKIHRLSSLTGAYTANDSSVYGQTFLNSVYNPAPVDLVSMHLLANYSEELERLFAGNLMFLWNEASRVLQLQRAIYRDEKVVLECVMEKTEQELLLDRWAKQWIQGWAHAELLETLGLIRSKYGTYPGAGGGVTLNGSELLTRADAEFDDLRRQIIDFEVGNGVDFQSPFLIG